MTIFLENIWIWIIASLLLFGMSGIFYQANNNRKILFLLIGTGIGVLVIGLVLVFWVQTDRKAVRERLFELADAVENNDLNAVLSSIDPYAELTRGKAVFYMKLAKIKKAKIRELKIDQINYFTSPPIAKVSFIGIVKGEAILLNTPFTVAVRFFEVELVKDENGQWLVTNQCSFDYPGYGLKNKINSL